MAEVIQGLFINPPLVIARLGGSTVPQDAYRWVEAPNARSNAETVVVPDWSLTVEADASVTPRLPSSLRFRDGATIRPVAPFIEVWARLGEAGSAEATWRDVPLTPALLSANGVTLANLTFRVTAMNAKVARRVGKPALRFGTFPPIEVNGDDHQSKALLATSPPGTVNPLIPENRNIPLGSVQVLRSRKQPAPGTTPWADSVNVEVLRLRFTPARGRIYGPPSAKSPHPTPRGGSAVPVDASRAFLNENAGWTVPVNPPDQPADTYDGADVGSNVPLGVVDDTCEARVEVSFALPNQGGRTVSASSTVFVAPPDFAPDRRPFLSLADELNDRSADAAARSAALTATDRDDWVENLFERIQETVTLLNLDFWRRARAATLTGNQLATAIPGDATPNPNDAMGGRDALRNRSFALAEPAAPDLLPLTQHARMRHRALSDLQSLRAFVQQNPGRLRSLVRRPFEIRENEDAGVTTMAMPPFMRNSNAQPLTLSNWQYDLLMSWVAALESGAAPAQPLAVAPPAPLAAASQAPQPISEAAIRRRELVLNRVRSGGSVR